MAEFDYDLFVIGAGSGGVRCSRLAAGFGARVAIAEERYFGGTCVNVGCVPKKLFYYAAHYREDFAAAQGFGWSCGETRFDWPTLRDNKTREIERLNLIYRELLDDTGVEIFNGHARIIDAHTVAIAKQFYRCRHILIATGAWPYIPEFPGRDYVMTSNELFHLDTFPNRVLIVGGGYIAVEFASIFKGLGAQVDLVYRGPLFLRHFDSDVRKVVADELRKKGITLRFESTVEQITKNEDGSLSAVLDNGHAVVCDLVLYATGRKPLLDNLGLENVNVAVNSSGTIKVDEYYQTTEPSIYAVGDVLDGPELTPVALAEGTILANHLFNNRSKPLDYNNIPTAVFCQPSIGTVGLTEEQARERYGKVAIYKSSFTPLKYALSGSEEQCFMKLIVEPVSDKVLGIHMVGMEAGEIIQGLAVAMKCGVTKAQMDATLGIHPTAAEEFVTMRNVAADSLMP